MATCQICEREIAVKGGAIARHGYRVIGRGRGSYGQQVGGSCLGAGHLPYERSCDLLPPLAERLEAEAARLDALRANAEADPSMEVPARVVPYGWSVRTIQAVPAGDPLYQVRKREWLARLNTEAKQARAEARHYRDRIAAWQPPAGEG